MWISLVLYLVFVAKIKIAFGITRQPCCTGIFSRGNSHTHHWQKGLQEAVYHSLTQHSAFDGSLDDRVERDRRLWKRIRDAEFSEELSIVNGIQNGVLLNKEYFLEFQPSNYNCRNRDCDQSVLAIWEIQRKERPKGYHILVKLPISQSYIEDAYEYTSYDGLKHLGVENKQIQYTHQHTIGLDNKHDLKIDRQDNQKPLKFPAWIKQKNVYNTNKKQINNDHDKNGDDSQDYDSDDKIIKIEPRRRYQYRDPEKPKKQGLILAFIPGNSQKEFQIPDEKYNGFIPIPHEPQRQKYHHDTYHQASQEEEQERRRIKVYRDIIRKYINQRNRPQTPPDFRPSKPYIQYSEPDPLYLQPSYTPQNEQKLNNEQNQFLVIHKFPENINSPGGSILGAVPTTVPYISVTVSNKIPVQNFNQIDLSTTPRVTEPPLTTMKLTTIPSSNKMHSTSNDVELITLNNNLSIVTTKKSPKAFITTTPQTETSHEELTTSISTSQPTTLLISIIKNLDKSMEDSESNAINRNIIKKDTSRNNENNTKETSRSNENNTITNANTISDSVKSMSNKISVTTETPPQNTTDKNPSVTTQIMSEFTDDNQTIKNEQKSSETNHYTREMITLTSPAQNTSTQTTDILITTTMTTPTTLHENNYNIQDNLSVISGPSVSMAITTVTSNPSNETTGSLTNEQSMTDSTTTMTETTTNYIDDAREQLADLFASLTFDLFNGSPAPPFIKESSNEETQNRSRQIITNSTETTDYTNYYDEYLNDETTEATTQYRQYLNHYTYTPNNKKSIRNLSKIFPFRHNLNSH